MKNRIVGKLFLGIGLAAALPFAGGCVQEARSSAQAATISSNPAPAVAEAAVSEPAATNVVNAATGSTNEVEDLPEIDIAEAPYEALPAERAVPSGVRTNGPLGEILRMADAGVEEGVLLAFVTNSTTIFALDADEVIYLNDIGIPSSVVTAMLQKDQALKDSGVPAPMPQEATAQAEAPAANTSALSPAEIAPQSPETATAGAAPPAPAETAVQPAPAPQPGVTYQTFYDGLSPYGNWVYVEGYGRAWQPTVVVVNPDWSPYVHGGRWLYTDAGWYWNSDYSWGWAPFHYGRWFRHYRLGWCWYPDTVWGPSWVTWRYNDGYCGWAPLPPGAWYRPGIGLTWWGRHVGVGFTFGLGYNSFAFVNWGHFHGHRHLHQYAVPYHRRHAIYRETVVATRIEGNRQHAANRGLPVQRVAAATGKPIRPVAIRESNNLAGRTRGERLGQDGRSIAVYRPKLTEGNRSPGRIAGRELGQTRTDSQARSIAANRFAGRTSAGGTASVTERKSWERPVSATRSVETRPSNKTAVATNSARNDRVQQGSTVTDRVAGSRTAPLRAQVGNRTTQSQSPLANRSITRNDLASRTQSRTPTTTVPSVNQRAVQPAAPSAPAASAAPTTTWQRGTVAGRTPTQTPNAAAQARNYTGGTAPVNRDWRAQANSGTWQRATPSASAPSAPSAPTAQPRATVPTYQRPQVASPTVPRTVPSAGIPSRQSLNPAANIAPQRQNVPTYNRAPNVPQYTAPAPTPSVQQPRVQNYSAPARTYTAPQPPARAYSPPSAPSRSYSAPSAPQSSPARSAPSRGGGWNRGNSDQGRGGR